MAPTKQELSLLINPLVPESVQHNTRVRSKRTSTKAHPNHSNPKLPFQLNAHFLSSVL